MSSNITQSEQLLVRGLIAVVKNDPYQYLCSIHGSTAKYFEYWRPEFTHVSVQDEAPVMN